MKDFEIDLTGHKDLIDKLKKLDTKVGISAIKKALRKAGGKIKNKVKMEAPEKTGNLKSSIKVFNDNSQGSKNGALIRVGANRSIAPHAHLVEFGTEERELKKPNRINVGNGFFTITKTGKMPKNNFFERGYDSSKDEAVQAFTRDITNTINSAV